MVTLYSRQTGTERQIAIGRVLTAAFFTAAMWIDPGERLHHADAAYGLIAFYILYAVVVLLLVPRAAAHVHRLQVVTQAVDVVVFSAFMYLSDAPTSLFFVFFVFTIITAAMRWQWRGAFATAAATILIFFGLGILHWTGRHNPEFELNGTLFGAAYLAVIAWLLAFLSLHETRLRREVGSLAAWSQDQENVDTEEATRTRMLTHAARTMGSQRVLMTWEDDEEPWLRIALWRDGEVTLVNAGHEEFSPLISPDLAGSTFVCPDAIGRSEVATVYGVQPDLRRYHGRPIHEAFADRFAIGPVVSAPVTLDQGEARLFFLDKHPVSSDDMMLADVIAGGAGLVLAESHLRARLRQSVAFEERVRLAQDLHDGVLQSLTGTALQLETARRLLERDVPAAREVMEGIQRSLATEQRELRVFVDQLKPARSVDSALAIDLPVRLEELRESVSRQWGIQVDVTFDTARGTLTAPDGLANDIYLMVREGLVNSARHAHAKHARATIRQDREGVEIRLEDDGQGFLFRGRHDMAALKASGMGPATLMRRVETRGGTLVVDSDRGGSRIEIAVPFVPAPAGAPSAPPLRADAQVAAP